MLLQIVSHSFAAVFASPLSTWRGDGGEVIRCGLRSPLSSRSSLQRNERSSLGGEVVLYKLLIVKYNPPWWDTTPALRFLHTQTTGTGPSTSTPSSRYSLRPFPAARYSPHRFIQTHRPFFRISTGNTVSFTGHPAKPQQPASCFMQHPVYEKSKIKDPQKRTAAATVRMAPPGILFRLLHSRG